MVYSKFDSTPSAHGESGDKIVFPLIRYGKPSINKGHQFLRKIIVHVVAHHSLLPVGVIGVQRGGHNHHKIFFGGIKLDIGFSKPVGVVAEGSVQQPENFIFLSAQIKILWGNFSFSVGQNHSDFMIIIEILAFKIVG